MNVSREASEEIDVVVVGAGVGGLRAAAKLQDIEAGGRLVSCRVLEARSRIGGRLLSADVDGGSIDLGATWFWPNEPRINQLISAAQLDAFAQHLDGDMMFQHDTVQRVSGNRLDAPSGRLAAGMQSIASTLAQHLPAGTIRFDQAVTAIRRTATGVDVSIGEQTIAAQHVVLAIPPSLAVATIDFGDDLADDVRSVAAATPVWMGATVKVVATFRHAFWRDDGLAGAAFSHRGPMREIHDMSGPTGHPAALFGFCALRPDQAAPTIDAVIDQFVALFGPQAATPREVRVMDWRREQYTTNDATVALTDYQTYGHPVFHEPSLSGRLHWAGTETSPFAPGHIEGALTAGDRAATAITRSNP